MIDRSKLSSKNLTNRKHTSNPKYVNNYDRIFKKEKTATKPDLETRFLYVFGPIFHHIKTNYDLPVPKFVDNNDGTVTLMIALPPESKRMIKLKAEIYSMLTVEAQQVIRDFKISLKFGTYKKEN